MQYPVPQFIEEEGKIVFFLTFRQFFILVGGGAVCFLLYVLLPLWVFAITSIAIMLLVGAIAFIKIDNDSIVKVLLQFLGFSFSNKNYIWRKRDLSYPLNGEGQGGWLHKTKKMIETKR